MSVWTSTMNVPLTGNSGNKNRKWPTLAILATATLLLSAISFIGVGAIPQPQQAFAQASNVTQTQSQIGSQSATAGGNINQDVAQLFDQEAQATGNVDQSVLQDVEQFANATGE
jgi:predicted PurR-regulated permease PerM